MMISHSKPTLDQKEICAVNSVLKNSFISQGQMVRKFEENFRNYLGARFCAATNSGTAALHLSLLALKIKPGDEVILPSFVCTAVLNAVHYVGAVPKIVDINREDFNIDIESVKRKINQRTRALIVPHMFGLAADMDALLKLNIPIVEDCALSIGAIYKNRKVGSFGRVAIFSFYATKMMTTAEGGMLVTNNRQIYEYALERRDYDHKKNYQVRYNYKMNEILAAIGLTQLNRLDRFISRRQKIAQMYNRGLADLDVQLPFPVDNKTHAYFRYVIKIDRNVDNIINRLRRLGVETKKPVYKPLHIYLGLNRRDYPATEEVYESSLSLPIYPQLQDSQIEFIIHKVKQVL